MGVMAARCRRPILERFFYLDDAGQALVAGLRGDHNRLGFSVQLTTVRHIGRFLTDPLDGVPAEVIAFLAGQLQIADPSCVKKYAQRQQTHLDHARKIRKALKLEDFAQVEAELAVYVGRRAWVTGNSPKAIFADAVGWLRERRRTSGPVGGRQPAGRGADAGRDPRRAGHQQGSSARWHEPDQLRRPGSIHRPFSTSTFTLSPAGRGTGKTAVIRYTRCC